MESKNRRKSSVKDIVCPVKNRGIKNKRIFFVKGAD